MATALSLMGDIRQVISYPHPEPQFLHTENESPRLSYLRGLIKPEQPVCLILCVNSDKFQRLLRLLWMLSIGCVDSAKSTLAESCSAALPGGFSRLS